MLDKLAKLHKFAPAITFLAMEIFALMAFSFGDSYILYGALSLALMLLLVLFNIRQIKVDGISTIAFFLFPLFLFTLLVALGIYSKAHLIVKDFNIAELIFVPLGLLPIAFSGYLVTLDKSFKIQTFLIVIYSALAALTLVNIIVNLVNFGAFYTVLYKGYHMYYRGEPSSVPIEEMAYTLQGLKFVEVKMSQYVVNPLLLLTSSIALLFIPFKNKKMFFLFLGYSVLGVIGLILFPSMIGGIFAVIILLIDALIYLAYKVKAVRKPLIIVLFVILGLFALALFAFILNYQTISSGFANFVANNSLLNRIFNTNRYAQKYSPLITNIFFDNFLGSWGSHSAYQDVLYQLTGSFVFDNVPTSGVIGALAFIVMLFVGFKGFKSYLSKEKEDSLSYKVVLLAFTSFFVIFSATLFEREYGVFNNIVRPISMSPLFMIMLFMFTYVITKGKMSEPKKEEQKEENKDEQEA